MPIPFVTRDYVLGAIYLWFGSIASIPGTFRLCDGTLGTPDLRNRFLNCAGDTYAVNANGGNNLHNHTFTSGNHVHNILGGAAVGIGPNHLTFVSSVPATGTTNDADKRPPYHSLAYIMYAGRIH